MNSEKLDTNFIRKWEAKYDSHENDEHDYKLILNQVSQEIQISKTISKHLFIKIINWKSPRLKGIIKLYEFENYYKPVIEIVIKENELKKKLNDLISLYGIKIPSATTILHFIYPDLFPIIDCRTVGALNHFKCIDFTRITENHYWDFFVAIHKIKSDTKASLREIDRALFSYHKTYLQNQSLSHENETKHKENVFQNEKSNDMESSNPTRILEKYIDESYKKTLNEFSEYLAYKYIEDKNQREIFMQKGVWLKVRLNYIAGLLLTQRGEEIFTPKEIREIVRTDLIPSIYQINDASFSGLILTQDVHENAKTEYNNGYTCLRKVDRGKYKFIGFQ
jgi:hypothetical protein